MSYREFEQYLLISHYLATRAACSRVPQLNAIVAKISVSLLRHTDVIPADRAFYQAGMYCKVSEGDKIISIHCTGMLEFEKEK